MQKWIALDVIIDVVTGLLVTTHQHHMILGELQHNILISFLD